MFLITRHNLFGTVGLSMQYDVVIVGAGPAGSTAARFLSLQGVKVLLIDKHYFPRDKPCAGVLLLRTLKRFPYLPQEIISSYSFGGDVSSSSMNNHFSLQKNEPIEAFVVRKEFDDTLTRIAVQAGAQFFQGRAVTDVQIHKEKVVVTLSDGASVESDLVIGADGVWSIVAKKSGLGQHYPHVGRCLFEEVLVERDTLDKYFTDQRHFHLYLKFSGIAGFGWVAPKQDCVNIGVGEMRLTGSQQVSRTLLEVYHEFLHFLEQNKLIPSSITHGKIQGGFTPLRPLARTLTHRVFLCGDAAGQINPVTGDGIHYAMVSGELAARVCSLALENGRVDASFLSQYETLWKKEFGVEIKVFNYVLKQLLKKHRDERYIRILSKNPPFVEFFVQKVNDLEPMQNFQWTMARRFALMYLRDLFE
jgi:geranylgeranyl reductase family protein